MQNQQVDMPYSNLINWIQNTGIEQTDDLLNYMTDIKTQIYSNCNNDPDFKYIVYNLLTFQHIELENQSCVYHACLDHQFFNRNGLNEKYIQTFKNYLAISGVDDNHVKNYLKLYALSQTITEQTLTIKGIAATQAFYQNEYIIYTDPNLEAGYCSVVCDKCGAKIVNSVSAFVEYLENVYSNKITGNEKISNFHDINCGNQFFTKIGVGIAGSKSDINSYEFIGLGDPTELARLQWKVLPDFSILGEVFKKNSNYLSGESRRRGGVRTNSQIDEDKIDQLRTFPIQNNVFQQFQLDQDIMDAFNAIPDDFITSNDVISQDVIKDLVKIRQNLSELLKNDNVDRKNLRISEQFLHLIKCFKQSFRGQYGRKSYQNIRELVEYLLKFKQFVDILYEKYNENVQTIYAININDRIQTVDTLIDWTTNVWKKIQYFVQFLFWSGENPQANQDLQDIRQKILGEQNAQQQQYLGKKILKWWYEQTIQHYEQTIQHYEYGVGNIFYNICEIFYNIYEGGELYSDVLDNLVNIYVNSQINDIQNFAILLYTYLLCQNDTENTNMFNQMICKLKHVRAQIKQVHDFRIARLIDLGKQIHCLQENGDSPQDIGRFDNNGKSVELYRDQMSKKYDTFYRNVEQFQNALRVSIAHYLKNPQVPAKCLFQILHQIPLNIQNIPDDQEIQQTNNVFRQIYDEMNPTNPNIVLSPIFDQVPLRPAPANAPANGINNGNEFIVQNANNLNTQNIDYFQKQTVKYMITHDMLKYHYSDITLQTQNNFVQKYITNQVGQKMNAIIQGVITNLSNGYYWLNKLTHEIQTVVQYDSHNYMVFIKHHRGDTYKIKLHNEDQNVINQNVPQYTPWEQIYLVINVKTHYENNQYDTQCDELNAIYQCLQYNNLQSLNWILNNGQYTLLDSLYAYAKSGKIDSNTLLKLLNNLKDIIRQHLVDRKPKPVNIITMAVYVNHGLFQINPQNKEILTRYKYFLELQADDFNQENQYQQNFFKLQLYGKFLYKFTQIDSVCSMSINMWLHADDNLKQLVHNMQLPTTVYDIKNSILFDDVENTTTNTLNILYVLNVIYDNVFLQNQPQPQGFMKSIIKQIIVITVLRSFVGDDFRVAYKDIINTKFEKIQDLINILVPQQNISLDYDILLQDIRNCIIMDRNNNFDLFIDALKNLAGQCDVLYPLNQQNVNLRP